MVNEWTRDDLPSLPDVLGEIATHERAEGAAAYHEAALAHLNDHFPKPPRDLHSMVLSQAGYVHDLKADLADMTRERDEWKARAEAAERDRDDDYSERSQKAAAWDRVAAHPALRMDLLPDVEGSYADLVFECITRLVEAAEARTAPEVKRADIEKAIRGKVWAANRDPNKAGFHRVHVDWATDAVCDLFGIEAEQAVDPVTEKARELWEVGGKHTPWSFDELSPETADEYRRLARHVLGQEADQ